MLSRCTAQGGVKVALIAIMVVTPSLAGPVRVFYSRDFDLRIPADPDSSQGLMEDALIFVAEPRIITDVDVLLNIEHTHVFDLQIYLRSPSGTEVCLNKYDFDEFFFGENYVETIFDDDALQPIESGEPPFTGRYRPRAGNLLSVFDGENAYGSWKIRINDWVHHDTGWLLNAGLWITTPVPEPGTVFLIGAGAILLRLKRQA